MLDLIVHYIVLLGKIVILFYGGHTFARGLFEKDAILCGIGAIALFILLV